jgi:hypothetical protein
MRLIYPDDKYSVRGAIIVALLGWGTLMVIYWSSGLW